MALFSTDQETIVAPITAKGVGCVAIVRVSGPQSHAIAQNCFHVILEHRQATHVTFFDKSQKGIDQGIAIFFRNPCSFTGEDLFEFQGHGNPVLVQLVIETLIQYPNVRLAEPGEFSLRAFLNGKLDLTQAEAIADLITSESKQQAQAAFGTLKGLFSKSIRSMQKQILELRTNVEACLDFIEEDFSLDQKNFLRQGLFQLKKDLSFLILEAENSLNQRKKIRVGIIGSPNVGKSSLFNKILEKESAIVTHICGTTRDLIEQDKKISATDSITFIDTAGLHHSEDFIEKIGIQRTQALLPKLDHILWVENAVEQQKSTDSLVFEALKVAKEHKIPVIGIFNKIDCLKDKAKMPIHHFSDPGIKWFYTSCKENKGIIEVIEALKSMCRRNHQENSTRFLVRERHLIALKSAYKLLKLFLNKSNQCSCFLLDQCAETLIQIQNILGEITGETYIDNIYDSIFSTFCLGK